VPRDTIITTIIILLEKPIQHIVDWLYLLQIKLGQSHTIQTDTFCIENLWWEYEPNIHTTLIMTFNINDLHINAWLYYIHCICYCKRWKYPHYYLFVCIYIQLNLWLGHPPRCTVITCFLTSETTHCLKYHFVIMSGVPSHMFYCSKKLYHNLFINQYQNFFKH
jgi:hypothetical protein